MQIALFLENEDGTAGAWHPGGAWRGRPDARHALRGLASGTFLGYEKTGEDWQELDAFAQEAFSRFPETVLFVQWETCGERAQLLDRLDFQALRAEHWMSLVGVMEKESQRKI